MPYLRDILIFSACSEKNAAFLMRPHVQGGMIVIEAVVKHPANDLICFWVQSIKGKK